MTQTDRILKHLQAGKAITPLAALRQYGCFRLAARINDLRNQGHIIRTGSIKRDGKIYASYRMVK